MNIKVHEQDWETSDKKAVVKLPEDTFTNFAKDAGVDMSTVKKVEKLNQDYINSVVESTSNEDTIKKFKDSKIDELKVIAPFGGSKKNNVTTVVHGEKHTKLSLGTNAGKTKIHSGVTVQVKANKVSTKILDDAKDAFTTALIGEGGKYVDDDSSAS